MAEFISTYRPQRLEDLIGQTAAIAKVRGMQKREQIPRQILITGPSGCGKTSLAFIMAYLFNGVKYGKPLPDLQDINVGTERGIDDMRQIAATANYAPHRKYRIIILDEIHRLTSQAAPAILKPLENPPPNTIWILVTSEPNLLLATIIRRCYQLPLRHPTPQEVVPLLEKISRQEKIEFPKQRRLLRELAQTAQGQPAMALQLLQGAADAQLLGSDYREIIQAAFAATPILQQTQLAVKCLICIYLGKLTQLVQVLQAGGNEAIPLTNALLQMNRWLLESRLQQATWRSPLTDRLAEYVGKVKVDDVIKMHQALVNLRAEVQRFIFPESHLVLARLAGMLREIR